MYINWRQLIDGIEGHRIREVTYTHSHPTHLHGVVLS